MSYSVPFFNSSKVYCPCSEVYLTYSELVYYSEVNRFYSKVNSEHNINVK